MPYNVDIGDGDTALENNIIADALDGTYWVSGWDATLGTGDLEVDIAAGSGAIEGTDVSTGSTQTIDFTGDPDGTDPRKAVIYVDATGTVQKSLGTPQPVDPTGEIRFRTYNPSPPASVSGVVVAEVWLAASETVLESADIEDRRVANQAAESATPNTPDWVEDGNSPLTETNTDEITYTLAGEYDIISISVKVTLPTDFVNLALRVNGDTGANYTYVDSQGQRFTGENSWSRPVIKENPDGDVTEVKISGSWGTRTEFRHTGPSSDRFISVSGTNSSVTSPLTQFTLFEINSNVVDEITVEVFGRNIG